MVVSVLITTRSAVGNLASGIPSCIGSGRQFVQAHRAWQAPKPQKGSRRVAGVETVKTASKPDALNEGLPRTASLSLSTD